MKSQPQVSTPCFSPMHCPHGQHALFFICVLPTEGSGLFSLACIAFLCQQPSEHYDYLFSEKSQLFRMAESLPRSQAFSPPSTAQVSRSVSYPGPCLTNPSRRGEGWLKTTISDKQLSGALKSGFIYLQEQCEAFSLTLHLQKRKQRWWSLLVARVPCTMLCYRKQGMSAEGVEPSCLTAL